MTWTTPITWSNSAVVGATELNEQIRDNLNFLKAPTFSYISTAHTADKISATASTGVPITAGISAAVTTLGGAMQVYFKSFISAQGNVYLNLNVDNTAITDLVGGLFQHGGGSFNMMQYSVYVTGLASGAHTFVPTWRQPNGNNMMADASGTPLVFWVREG